MDSNSGDGVGDNNSLHDSFMTSGQYIVEGGGDADETLGTGENDDDHNRDNEPLREQDRFLPIANVARIMKKSIPKTGKIAKDAKECVQECVSEFISFITSESAIESVDSQATSSAQINPFCVKTVNKLYLASERCHQEKRKTINGEDILFAMSTLGFDSYVEPLKLYLQKYRESSKGEKGSVNATGGGSGDNTIDELAEESFSQTLPTNILTEQPGQHNVIYTTYPGQISFG